LEDLTPDDEIIDETEKEEIPVPAKEAEPEVIEELEEPETIDKPEQSSTEDLTGYYNFLKQTGALNVPDDFEFDGSEESFEKALTLNKETTRNNVASEIWEALPEDFKPLLSYALNGGSSLKNYLDYYTPVDYDSVDLDDVDNQKKLLTEYYQKTSNHSDEKISKFISRLENSGDLFSEASDALVELKSLKEDREAKLIEQAKIEQERKLREAQEEITQINASIEKLNADNERKKRLKTLTLVPIKYEDKTMTQFDHAMSRIYSNPDHFIQLADLVADYNEKSGFNFDRLKSKIKAESNTSLKNLIDNTLGTTKKGSSVKQVKDDFDLNEINKRN